MSVEWVSPQCDIRGEQSGPEEQCVTCTRRKSSGRLGLIYSDYGLFGNELGDCYKVIRKTVYRIAIIGIMSSFFPLLTLLPELKCAQSRHLTVPLLPEPYYYRPIS